MKATKQNFITEYIRQQLDIVSYGHVIWGETI